jgi:hypothetical protein
VKNSGEVYRRQSIVLVGLCVLLGLSFGCAKKAPAWGDEKTKGLVLSIARAEVKKQTKAVMEKRRFGATGTISDEVWGKEWQQDYTGVELFLENITTKNIDEKVGSYQCAAILIMSAKGKGEVSRYPITFSSELSAEKEGEFVVAVQGL